MSSKTVTVEINDTLRSRKVFLTLHLLTKHNSLTDKPHATDQTALKTQIREKSRKNRSMPLLK